VLIGEVEDAQIGDASPLLALLGDSLMTSIAGLEVAIELIGDLPAAAALLAVAAVTGADRDAAVLAPPELRAKLAAVTLAIATSEAHGNSELAALTLYLLSRLSAGDHAIASVVASALATTERYAAQLIAALGELRVADEQTATVLTPLLTPERPLGLRVAAAAICGRALPRDHAAWSHVRELLSLGPIASAAAWRALHERARRE
jgi:hypothetical protein